MTTSTLRPNLIALGVLAAFACGAAAQEDPVRLLVTKGRYWQERGRGDRAADAWQKILRLNPNQPDALYGMGRMEADAGRAEGARAYLDRLRTVQPGSPLVARLAQTLDGSSARPAGPARLPQQAHGPAAARPAVAGHRIAEDARARARAALQRGDVAGARRVLEDAMAADPTNPWIRFDAAREYAAMGRKDEARAIMDGLLLSNPDLPDALYASALLHAETGDWQSGLDALERIPPRSRTADMGILQRRLWVHAGAERARALAGAGQRAEALALLRDAERHAQQDAGLTGALALAYAEAGDEVRALSLMRQAKSRAPLADAGLQLQYAAMLLKTRQDAELAGVLRQLSGAGLNTQQRRDYDDLRVAYIVRQADALTESGDLVAAYDMLAPALSERGGSAAVRASLARMYAQAGEHEQALALYESVLEKEPRNLEMMLAAIGSATAAKAYERAEGTLQTALAQAPDSPKVLTAAGRLYRAQGETARAADYFRAAVAAENAAARAGGRPAGAGFDRVPANPFVGLPGQRGSSQLPPPGSSAAYPAVPGPAAMVPALVNASSQPDAQPYIPAPAMAPASYLPEPAAGQPRKPAPAVGNGAAPAARSRAPWLVQAEPQASRTGPWTAQEELRDIASQRTATMGGGPMLRGRNGDGGMSQLTEMQMTAEARMPVGDGKLVARVTPVVLDSGSLGGDFSSASRFGGGPWAAAMDGKAVNMDGASLRSASPGSQNAFGAAVGVAYESERFNVDVGSTPLGFRYTDVNAGARVSLPVSQRGTFSLGASRRPVTDSLLSYAGARDERLGLQWGGVMLSNARADLGWDDGFLGIYGYGGYGLLTGHDVKRNTRWEGGGGFYMRLIDKPDQRLTSGVNFTAMGYAYNLRYFTFGQGGYFSPQTYFAVTVPLALAGRSGRLAYQVRGALGMQAFREDDSNYFPTNGQVQSAANDAIARAKGKGLTNAERAVYGGQSKTGLAYNLVGSVEYQAAQQLYVGGLVGLDNARDYRQWYAGLYVRYALERQSGAVAFPPVAPQSAVGPLPF